MSHPTFEDSASQKLWDEYFVAVQNCSQRLNERQQKDMEMEIKAHLLEAFAMGSGDESERLSNALNRLGEPSEYVPLWVEERLLNESQPFSSLHNLYHLSLLNARKGLGRFALSILFGLGYVLSLVLIFTSIFKLFYPENIGFYTSPEGLPILGYVEGEGFKEHLGYWLVPIGMVVGVSLQLLLNKLIRRFMR